MQCKEVETPLAHVLSLQCRKVKVKQIAPGAAPPPEEECDFWYDQEHDRRYFTFTDSLSAPPASKEHYQGLAGRRVRDGHQCSQMCEQCHDAFMCRYG